MYARVGRIRARRPVRVGRIDARGALLGCEVKAEAEKGPGGD